MNREAGMTNERFVELAARSLLEDLPNAEAAELDAELARRGADGRAVLRDLRETLGTLALAVPPVAPPAGLEERVLAEIRRQNPVAQPVWLWAAAATVAALLALGLGVANLRLKGENQQLRAEIGDAEAALARADTTRAHLDELRSDFEVLAAPAADVVQLSGSGAMPDARARVFIDPATGRALLFAYDLPILAPGTVYELWAIADGAPRAAGVFRPTPAGDARLEITDASLLADVDALAVTVEPAPGTEAPTSEPVLIS